MTVLQSVPRFRKAGPAMAAALGLALLPGLLAQKSMYDPPVALPGGLNPRPYLMSIIRTQGVANVTWAGIHGPYQLLQKTNLSDTAWQAVGGPTTNTSAQVALQDGNAFLAVTGGDDNYVGVQFCRVCHKTTAAHWTNTIHATALQALKDIHQDTNPACIGCHTVGYGFDGGYKDQTSTAFLANVQCENCHGPGGRHISDFEDPSLRPIVSISAAICGGCHTDSHHPTYDEWKDSKHAEVTEDVAGGFTNADGTPNNGRMMQCGVCHSGAVRVALINQAESGSPQPTLPTAADAAKFGITCAVCHDAHSQGQGPGGEVEQTRYPTYSLDNYSYASSSDLGSFVPQYNPNIQVCAQCHNMRGAKWTDTSRPPHHSPQYNMLIGQGGYDLGVSKITTHGLETEDQCASCHVYAYEVANPTDEDPNYKGHTFLPAYEACVDCHGSAEGAQAFAEATKTNIVNRINDVVGLLNSWATNKAPAALKDKYGVLSWEYNVAGVLGNPTGDSAIKGPTSAEQANVPDAIKQARMNLYLVEHDGSFGVHNGDYAKWLISVAKTNVLTELAKP